MNKIQEVKELVNQLKGISNWLYATNNDILGKTMSESAKYLDNYSDAICCAGVICNGGENCTSDHK